MTRASSSTAARCSSVSSAGTATSTVTSRSPVGLPAPGTPRPLTRKVRPDGVPAGTRRVPALEGGHRQRGPEGRLGETDRDGQGQVAALATENAVAADVDDDVQVAGGAAGAPPHPGP